jgi:hypothetical protein
MMVGDQYHVPAVLPLGEGTRQPFYKMFGGSQDPFRRVRKNLSRSGFDPRNVQPVASRYTEYAVPSQINLYVVTNNSKITSRRCVLDL